MSHDRLAVRRALRGTQLVESLEQRRLLAAEGTGLRGQYFDNLDFTGVGATRRDPVIDFSWTNTQSPVSGIAALTNSIRWTGRIEAIEGGTYTFRTYSDDGVRLTITDGNATVVTPLIDNWTNHSPTYNTATFTMEAGRQYDITLEYYNNTGPGTIQLAWQRPGHSSFEVVPTSQLYLPLSSSGGGMPVTFYDNMDFTGNTVTRHDPQINLNTGYNEPPITGIGGMTYSAVWEGQLESIEAGTYQLRTYSDDGVRVYLAESDATSWGTPVIDNWIDHSPTYDTSGNITLQADRKYKLRVEYYNNTGYGVMQLQWKRPGHSNFTIVPTTQLYGPELLTNPSLEGASNLAAGYGQNPFGSWSYSKTTAAGTVHGGSSAQVVSVTSTGGQYIFGQGLNLEGGHVYEATFWLRSPTTGGVDVDVMVRQTSPFYEIYANQRVHVGSAWQKVTIRGGPSGNNYAMIGIWFNTPGVLHVDDASLTDVTASINNRAPLNTATPVDAKLMGMHFNRGGWDQTKRTSVANSLGFGMVRFWDTGTMWANFEPSKGNWNTTLISNIKGAIQQWRNANPDMEFIMTLGIPPTWAASDPSQVSPYGSNTSKSAPASITDWEDYVEKLATEFDGLIKYWEIWNEVDNSGIFYSGTMTQNGSVPGLIELTAAARGVLKSINSQNMILSPNFLRQRTLSDFLYAGGGDLVDIVSFHTYTSGESEKWLPRYNAFRAIMDHHGKAGMPLWNTEGAVNTGSDTDTSQGVIARSFITQWLNGISNYNWYFFEANRGRLTYGTVGDTNWTSITPNGVAYGEVQRWLTGAQSVKRTVTPNGTWIVELARPDTSYKGWIIWHPTLTTTYNVSTSWGATRYRKLDASVTSFTSGSLAISPTPILVENMAPPAPMGMLMLNDGSAQRSKVSDVSLVFDAPVKFNNVSPFTVVRRNPDGSTQNMGYRYSNPSGDHRTFVLDLTGVPYTGGSLANGVYEVTVKPGAVHNYWLRSLASQSAMTYTFGRLFGDGDGNLRVDDNDFAVFKSSYGRRAGDALFRSELDYDGNGVLNNLDLAAFKDALGASLTL